MFKNRNQYKLHCIDRRLICLTPAGFHLTVPLVGYPIVWGLPPVFKLARLFYSNFAGAIYLPTWLARMAVFKFLVDSAKIPPLRELLKRTFSGLMSNDVSQWDKALQLGHYNADAMPAASLHQVRVDTCLCAYSGYV